MRNAAFVVKIRNSLNMSLREFGKAVGVSHNAVWLWEKGKMKPNNTHLAIIKSLERHE